MISDDIVERVREAADIVQVIGEHVKLRRVGTDWRGPCPFHQGTNPNFSVSPKRGQYHCFVCHESGDVISFIREKLGLDFTSAVKLLGERFGVDVIETQVRSAAPDPNEPNWEVLAHAAAFFQKQLAESPEAATARTYLEGRDINADAWSRFGIGFAPRDGTALVKHLAAMGFDGGRMLEAGLVVLRDGESEPRPRFRGRVMFPIVDERGRHVAFGGRALGDDQPKYLNSSESSVFHKRQTLYGLHSARQAARKAGRMLLVEGYLDVIRVALGGIDEVVAPLGTALTEEQSQLLVRYAREVFILFDSDEAGRKATFRSGLELLRHGAVVRVVSLPDGDDPDTFVRTHGGPALERVLADALDVFDLQIELLQRKGWFSDMHRSRRAIDKLLPTIRATRDEITRDLYLARLAEVSHVDKALLVREAAESGGSPGRALTRTGTPTGPGGDRPPPPTDSGDGSGAGGSSQQEDAPSLPKREWQPSARFRGRNAGPVWMATTAAPRIPQNDDPIERELVRAMLRERGWVEIIAERHGPAGFRTDRYRALFEHLLGVPVGLDLGDVLASLPESLAEVAQQLLDGPDAPSDVQHTLQKLQQRELREQMAELQRQFEAAGESEKNALLAEKQRVARELQALLSPPTRDRTGRSGG